MALCHPFLFLISFCSCFITYGQFDFKTPKVKSTYEEVLSLRVNSAQLSLKELRDTTIFPINGITPLLENYLDIITLLTVENKELYKKLKPNENKRVSEIKGLDKNSPYYLYTLADIKLQWSFVELIYQDYFNGFVDLRKANELIDKNIKLYPNFYLNNKVKGLIDLLTEATPEEANLALLAAGLKRSKDGKKKLIKTAVFEPSFKTEIDIYLTFVDAYVKNNEKNALWKIEKTYNKNPDNLFAQFTYLNILSKLNKHEEILELMDTNSLYMDSTYLYIPYLDYLKAESKMYTFQLQESIECFKKFISITSTPAFQKTASFSTALAYSALGNTDSSKFYLNKVLTLPKSDLYLDEYAQFESKHKALLSQKLSIGRILFDAKNIEQSHEILSNINPYSNRVLETERQYRLGRAEWTNGNEAKALELFKKATELSSPTDYTYYGAYSCFYVGYILDKNGKKTEAKQYYNLVKKYKNHYYVDHITKKANLKISQIED